MLSKRILELDGLRGIAVIMVMLYHYFYRYNAIYSHQELPVSWSQRGNSGVLLFFMISGFVIFLTINHIKNAKDFIISRFFRLYPIYWFSILLTFTCISIFTLPGRETSLLNAFLNGLMFHQYFGIPNVDGVYWTLKIELTFYVFMFLLYITKLLSKIDYIILIISIFTFVGKIASIKFFNIFSEMMFVKFFTFFSIGILLYQLKYKSSNKLSIGLIIFNLVLIQMIFSWLDFMISIFFTSVFYFTIHDKITFLKNKYLVFIGVISYPIYLIHQNIGYLIINKLYEYNMNPILGIGLLIAFIFYVSYLMHYYLEKPILKYSKTLKSK